MDIPNYVDLLAIVDKKGLTCEQIEEGDKFDLDKDITIEVFFLQEKIFLLKELTFRLLYLKLYTKSFLFFL